MCSPTKQITILLFFFILNFPVETQGQDPQQFCINLLNFTEHSQQSFEKVKGENQDLPQGRWRTNESFQSARGCEIDLTFMPVCECTFMSSYAQGKVRKQYEQLVLWIKQCLGEEWKLNSQAANDNYKGSSLQAVSPDGRTLVELGVAGRPNNEFELILTFSRF